MSEDGEAQDDAATSGPAVVIGADGRSPAYAQ